MFNFLLRLAYKVLEGVMSQLMQQFNVVQEQALSPIRMIVQQVTGGIWKGDGANAFVEEVSSLMIPGIGRVGNSIQSFHSNLGSARDIIQRADSELNRLVQSRLVDVFKFY
ncbi:MAG: hypothetical protein KAX40_02380 [Herpetosiphon sp.]|nr:hypothetical protein [Herpetosiphon sp.]